MECETLEPCVNLRSPELDEIKRKLRSEFGPFVLAHEGAEREDLGKVLLLANRDLEEHEAQYQRLDLQRATLQSLLSPMRRLPNETLLHIFEYVCDENLLQNYPYHSDSKSPAKSTLPIICLPTMTISSVCFRWRELALSSPGLWAGLAVITCSFTSIEAQSLAGFVVGFISTLDLFLERSGDWPLKLVLNIEEMDPPLTCLTRHAHRWSTLKYYRDPSKAFQIPSNLRFPSLTKLDLLYRFEHSPILRSVVSNEFGFQPKNIPFHQLHYIDLQMHHEGFEALCRVLRQCPSLKSLGLQCATTPRSRAAYRKVGVLPNITSLFIRGPTTQSWNCVSEEIFPSFRFPSLNELRVKRMEQLVACNIVSWPRDAFISFVSRSSCIITTFTILGISLSDMDLIASLQVMPSLLRLEVNDKGLTHSTTHQSPITPHLLASLIQDQSDETLPISLVPKLHSLRLLFNGTAFDDCVFVSMVESRWFKPGSNLQATKLTMGMGRIRSVVLKFFQRNVPVELYKPLRVLDEEGLRVVVAGTNGAQI
ncbi:hypothetical protein BDP27DRAFT_1319196 [Rhodocollybia butyracea]|uniref:F-box domain-containing protein n=1 Tax=Rhodocollybia butyracea TaxID=206335 RepID=A0A9P5UBQ0_9AGAR|nr:hypothetical protein BDP27DRAFT_1319196 [Rhodocollybia butyracea]